MTLNATSGGAIKTYLETSNGTWNTTGSGVPIYRDNAPDDDGTGKAPSMPYIVITDGLANVVEPRGGGANQTVIELCQVDVWQQWRAQTVGDTNKENAALAGNVARVLNMTGLLTAPQRAFFCVVKNGPRMLDVDSNTVVNHLSLEIHRFL